MVVECGGGMLRLALMMRLLFAVAATMVMPTTVVRVGVVVLRPLSVLRSNIRSSHLSPFMGLKKKSVKMSILYAQALA